MPVLKHRNRIVVFRLTQDEYEKLLIACARRGARNMTDFARTAVLSSIDGTLANPAERGYLPAIDQKITSLRSEVQRLVELMESQLGRLDPAGRKRKSL